MITWHWIPHLAALVGARYPTLHHAIRGHTISANVTIAIGDNTARWARYCDTCEQGIR